MVETRSKQKARNVEKVGSKRISTETSTQPTKRRKTKTIIDNKVTLKSESTVIKINPTLSSIHEQLAAQASKKRAATLVKYFRTDEYGRGDIFLGLKVPYVRSISKSLGFLPFTILKSLIESKYHEERLLSVINIVDKFKISQDLNEQKELFEFYTTEMKEGIDNWDLVDMSAAHVVGSYLINKPELKKTWLYEKLITSERLWDRRIAIVSTQLFINRGEYEDTVKLSEILLDDKEDLIHKATGWMLREMGKVSLNEIILNLFFYNI